MYEEIHTKLLNGTLAINAGPTSKELFLERTEVEFNRHNYEASTFYQVRALFKVTQERYCRHSSTVAAGKENKIATDVDALLQTMNDWEREDFKTNPLMQFAYKSLKNAEIKTNHAETTTAPLDSCDFLRNITDAEKGWAKISEICQSMPEEWTILQLCKGACQGNTYNVFPRIHEGDAAIYVTILKHARSSQYAKPISLRFNGAKQQQLFKMFAKIAGRFRECMNVDSSIFKTREDKVRYWEQLKSVDKELKTMIDDLHDFFYPWTFLFSGMPTAAMNYQRMAFAAVDQFAEQQQLKDDKRVLLSLVALKLSTLSDVELHAICNDLLEDKKLRELTVKMLQKILHAAMKLKGGISSCSAAHMPVNYPCMLIVDERLDHFFWEQLNVQQEFCRVNNLQCLWRLYEQHKQRIENGYLKVNITTGACLVNPDGELPKMELRMRAFFNYWTPHWQMKIAEKPTPELLYDEFFKHDCFVYCGHGSGLQYIHGKHISKLQLDCVVFLFGCDSSRMHSTGLYSELTGSHLYYHAAMCPTLVGTLMPGLDSNMDTVATRILSHWIAPESNAVMPWHQVDNFAWSKQGIIKAQNAESAATEVSSMPNYMASLCSILSLVHQRKMESKLYNTVLYVCRGLPAWNCNIQTLPTK